VQAWRVGDERAETYLDTDMRAALMVRSPTYAERYGGAAGLFDLRRGHSPSPPPPARAARPLRLTPIGQTLSVASDRARRWTCT
jgi:hypothetical protein